MRVYMYRHMHIYTDTPAHAQTDMQQGKRKQAGGRDGSQEILWFLPCSAVRILSGLAAPREGY